MYKWFMVMSLTILLAFSIVAQSNDEYHKNEFSGGYLYRQPIEITSNTRILSNKNANLLMTNNLFPNPAKLKFHGFNISYVRNFHRYLGVRGEFSRVNNTEELRLATIPITIPPNSENNFRIKSSLTNILGGIQVKDNSKETRIKPFAHALFGVGHESKKPECFGSGNPVGGCPTIVSSKRSFATILGGGLDIKINKRIDIRAIQFDYNPMKIVTGSANPLAVGSEYSNKYRIGFGIVVH